MLFQTTQEYLKFTFINFSHSVKSNYQFFYTERTISNAQIIDVIIQTVEFSVSALCSPGPAARAQEGTVQSVKQPCWVLLTQGVSGIFKKWEIFNKLAQTLHEPMDQ